MMPETKCVAAVLLFASNASLCVKMCENLFIVQGIVNKKEIYTKIAAYFRGREDNLFPKVLPLTSPDLHITELERNLNHHFLEVGLG